jgi:hypothetical protein
MRLLLFATLVVALGFASALPQPSQDTRIEISADTGGSAAVWASRSEIYLDVPEAGVGKSPGTSESSPSLMFMVRSWKEIRKARVVVYARLKDTRAPGGATETPIATFLMARGETRAVPEADKWGGPHVTVTAR